MHLTKNTVMIIWVELEAGETFDVTGHYPVLAGLDSTGEPLYIAINDIPSQHLQTFTCIKNGASHATFIDENGETETVNEFYVLVLRHNPVNFNPTSVPEGAMDPTGPVFWLNCWPKKDPSLSEDLENLELETDQFIDSVIEVSTRWVGSGFEVRTSNNTREGLGSW